MISSYLAVQVLSYDLLLWCWPTGQGETLEGGPIGQTWGGLGRWSGQGRIIGTPLMGPPFGCLKRRSDSSATHEAPDWDRHFWEKSALGPFQSYGGCYNSTTHGGISSPHTWGSKELGLSLLGIPQNHESDTTP